MADDISDFAIVTCPECLGIAEAYHPVLMRSTDGPVLMVKVRCWNNHHFFMPAADVPGMPEPEGHHG